MNLLYKSNYSHIYLTNFLPIITTNMLKKGEKEKSFVKVNKVLQKIKKTTILQDSFIINRKIFLNKIYYFGFKNTKFVTASDLIKNQSLFFSFSKKTREIHNFLLKVRIFFFISNLYSNDFLQYQRYKNNFLKNIFDKKMKLLNNRSRIKIKLLVKKKNFELFFNCLKNNKFNFIIKTFNNKLLKNDLLLNHKYDLKVLINNLSKNFFFIKKILIKKQKIFKITKTIIFKNFNYLNNLNKKKNLIKITKNFKKNKKYRFRKYYYLNKKMKLVKNEHYKLNKRFFLFKKLNKRMTRFEFKKRKYLYDKLKKIYKKSRFAFFKYKRKIFLKKKKNLRKKKNFIQNFSTFSNFGTNFGTTFGLKLFVTKKPIIDKKIKRKNFFKYSIFPVLFSPVNFLNIILSKYRLYFTFKEKRLWGKNQLIPSILNLKRDIRITARNFKKSLQDIKFESLNFETAIYESLLSAGAKKGFLLKIKQQAYIFMLKNAIFLQFMLRRRKKVSRKKRRKKIDRK